MLDARKPINMLKPATNQLAINISLKRRLSMSVGRLSLMLGARIEKPLD